MTTRRKFLIGAGATALGTIAATTATNPKQAASAETVDDMPDAVAGTVVATSANGMTIRNGNDALVHIIVPEPLSDSYTGVSGPAHQASDFPVGDRVSAVGQFVGGSSEALSATSISSYWDEISFSIDTWINDQTARTDAGTVHWVSSPYLGHDTTPSQATMPAQSVHRASALGWRDPSTQVFEVARWREQS